MRTWETLAELQEIIEDGYASLGYKDLGDLGYRFLSSPESTLWSDRMIISINPAGNQPDYENDGMFAAGETSAYVDERWLAAPMGSRPLQKQYQEVFKLLDWSHTEVLQAPFSPYRHPSWHEIPSKIRKLTEEFCIGNIWRPYFAKHCPSQIVCVGKPPAEALCKAMPYDVKEVNAVPTGWNNTASKTATIYQFENDAVMVQVPHLSRFGIMTSSKSADHLGEIFAPLLPQ